MKLLTSEQMRRIDEITIRERGVPGATLMERAGRAVAREALDRFEPESIAIVTGRGNNAGDGFVAARELARLGAAVTLFMIRPPEELAGDALDAYEKMPAELPRHITPEPRSLTAALTRYDLIIDALFGTGLSRPLEAPWDAIVEAINRAGVPVLSIDIPSGLSGDAALEDGAELGPHVRAAATVTIGRPKLGLMLGAGARAAGAVIVEEIGFPEELLESPEVSLNLTTLEEAAGLLPPRPGDGHKGTFGRVMILGGSEGMTGAAVLAARSAARSGAGLVYCAYPQALGQIMESHLIEPVKLPLAGDQPWFTLAMAKRVIEESAQMQAVAIGPGLGRQPETRRFLREVMQNVTVPLVIDADALNLLAEQPVDLARRMAPTILTPHPAEAARLLKRPLAEVQAQRLDVFLAMARDYRTVVVLKGDRTVITAPDGQRYINTSGNSGLAKGGSGDVLTGLIAGLAAQGCAALDAARLGVFLHGMAADIASQSHGVRAMLPSDVIESFGPAFTKLEAIARASARQRRGD